MDNVCIESFSLTINNRLLDQANNSIKILEQSIVDEGKLKTQMLKEETIRLATAQISSNLYDSR